MNIVAQANLGRRILRDWLGKGGQPVTLAQAQARADVCLSCPYNYNGHWTWKLATAIAINSQLKLRQVMRLTLQGEEKLKICDRCGCQLRLKVHVPFEHIYSHTSDEQFSRFPSHCWQITELNQTKHP